MEGEQGTFW